MLQDVTLVGIDLGKHSFHLHGQDRYFVDAEAICEAASRPSMIVTPKGFVAITGSRMAGFGNRKSADE